MSTTPNNGTNQYFLVATTLFLVGCENRAPAPPVAQTVVKMTPQQVIAALVEEADAGDAEAQYGLRLMSGQNRQFLRTPTAPAQPAYFSAALIRLG